MVEEGLIIEGEKVPAEEQEDEAQDGDDEPLEELRGQVRRRRVLRAAYAVEVHDGTVKHRPEVLHHPLVHQLHGPDEVLRLGHRPDRVLPELHQGCCQA